MHGVPDGCLRPMEAVVMTHVELFNLSKRCGNNSYWYLLAVAAREWLNCIAGLMWDNRRQRLRPARKRSAARGSPNNSMQLTEYFPQ